MVTNKTSHKIDDFDCPIVNFPFICSNIPAAAAYAVYTSHLSDIPAHVVYLNDFFNRVAANKETTDPRVPSG
jgi:hypothetical protein